MPLGALHNSKDCITHQLDTGCSAAKATTNAVCQNIDAVNKQPFWPLREWPQSAAEPWRGPLLKTHAEARDRCTMLCAADCGLTRQ